MTLRISVLSILIISIQLTTTTARQGTVHNQFSVQSEILDRDMSYSIYLPESYGKSTREYPVLYLLHGMTGDHNDWINLGEVHRIAGEVMASGRAPEMIIIMPDGLYDAFYINNYDGSVRWEDFFHEEFIPAVEEEFRITTSRNKRAIAGLSMGGYGAMYHGVNYKEKFGSVYAMSAAFLEAEPMPEAERNEQEIKFHRKLWGPYNDEMLPENYKEHSIQEMFKAMEPIDPANNGWNARGNGEEPLPSIFIDCGDDDFLLRQNTNLVHILKEKNVPFEFRVHNGGHTWEYWRTALDDALVFAGKVFRR